MKRKTVDLFHKMKCKNYKGKEQSRKKRHSNHVN